MGLSCLIGGTPLEKLSFQLRLTYCVGDLKRLSLWQLRNCIIRNKKEPVGSVHFGPLLYQVLQAMAKLRLGSSSLMDFTSFDETFLLIDGTSYSPVLQVGNDQKEGTVDIEKCIHNCSPMKFEAIM